MKAGYMVQKDKHNLFFFLVKMFKLLGILFILKLYAGVGIFTKINLIWKSYFWKKRT